MDDARAWHNLDIANTELTFTTVTTITSQSLMQTLTANPAIAPLP
jgi:hypothetical protein